MQYAHIFSVILHVDIDSDDHLNPMTSSKLTLGGGQAKVRSNQVKFAYQYLCIKSTCLWFRKTSEF